MRKSKHVQGIVRLKSRVAISVPCIGLIAFAVLRVPLARASDLPPHCVSAHAVAQQYLELAAAQSTDPDARAQSQQLLQKPGAKGQ
jgi:hypothetical protein